MHFGELKGHDAWVGAEVGGLGSGKYNGPR